MTSPILKYPIESLLSGKQLLEPQMFEKNLYFISNSSGMFSLWIQKANQKPKLLLPENIGLQNPLLMHGSPIFKVFPLLKIILVMIDKNGNELYQPHTIGLEGGIPTPLFKNKSANQQLTIVEAHINTNIVFFSIDDRVNPGFELIKVNLTTLDIYSYGKRPYGTILFGASNDYKIILIGELYGLGDRVVFIKKENDDPKLLFGKPLEDRKPDEKVALNNFDYSYFVENDTAILFKSSLFNDSYSITWLSISDPSNISEIQIKGLKHNGSGELDVFEHLKSDLFLIGYNIDGCSVFYEVRYLIKKSNRLLIVERNLVGLEPPLINGVILGYFPILHEKNQNEHINYLFAFTKAITPSQIYLLSSKKDNISIKQLIDEKVQGISQILLSEGEDASYTSFDGLRISTRIYRPAEKLGFKDPRPLVLYIHGGPTVQERPNFSWFSMPIIQFLTLHGFTVLVPNTRGSTGYGFKYMNKINKDWGGDDLKDHLELIKLIKSDPLVDSSNIGVMGRSYGGFMTLSLISRHPEVNWKAAVDMFGPYDLIGFYNRLPPSWQTALNQLLGNPENEEERDLLISRSPKTFFENIEAPLLVIQGANDPRILLDESKEIVARMKDLKKQVKMIVFDDEGHDVLKFDNKVKTYQEITKFFVKHLNP